MTEHIGFIGLGEYIDRKPSELSGGQRRRVAIARALVIQPQLILYDEPTSELDPLMSVTIGEEILNLSRRIEVTSIVVTHDRELAFGIGDRVALIHEGNIILVGTPAELRASTDPTVRKFLDADHKLKPKQA